MKQVIVIGAGGHGRVIADTVLRNGDRLLGFLDDAHTESVWTYPVLGKVQDWHLYVDTAAFVLGIGSNAVREQLSKDICGPWYTAVHPSAQIGQGVELGAGTVVMAGAVINTGAHIGAHCIVNTGAVVEHDSILEDFVHISPHATLCGTVQIGGGTHVGAGAVVRNNCIVCSGCTLGAGTVVVKDITEPGVYAGIPARRIK